MNVGKVVADLHAVKLFWRKNWDRTEEEKILSDPITFVYGKQSIRIRHIFNAHG